MRCWYKKAFNGNKNFNQKPILKSVWKIHAAYSFFKKIKEKIMFSFRLRKLRKASAF